MGVDARLDRLGPSHPYSPADIAIPSYEPNESPLWLVTGSFAVLVAGLLSFSAFLAASRNPALCSHDILTVCWFVLCGFLHCTFESYFVLNHTRLASLQSFFGQLWKEYALSDSRYLTSDPFMVSVEALTVVLMGPLSIVVAYTIIGRSVLRHPLQIVVCSFHLFSVALYYGTSYADLRLRGVVHSRPEFLYYWVYYAGFNLPWVVVPIGLLISSFRTVCRALKALDDVEGPLGMNGALAGRKRPRTEQEARKDR